MSVRAHRGRLGSFTDSQGRLARGPRVLATAPDWGTRCLTGAASRTASPSHRREERFVRENHRLDEEGCVSSGDPFDV